MNDYDLKGRVIAGVTDSEQTMKAGRTLPDAGVFHHVGGTKYRLESTIGIVFRGKCMALAHALVTRYTKSSREADRLAE